MVLIRSCEPRLPLSITRHKDGMPVPWNPEVGGTSADTVCPPGGAALAACGQQVRPPEPGACGRQVRLYLQTTRFI